VKSILLVMHSYPSNSSFLMNKYLLLGKVFNIKLLVWDKNTGADSTVYYGLPGISFLEVTKEFFKAGITFISHPLNAISFMKNLGIKKFLKGHYFIRENFDLIHFEFGTLATEWIDLKKFIEAKLLVSFRGYDLNYYQLNNQAVYNEVWKNADAFHFLGKDLYQRALQRNYGGEKPNYFISPAIDLNLFSAPPSKTNFNSNVLQIVSVGRLVWKKGYEYGLKAIRILLDKNYKIHYTLIGDGEHKQAIEYCIHELALNQNVTLLYHRSLHEIKNQLAVSDLFLHPALSEGFCNAVVEAQAMKLPIVCTKADGLTENIEEGVTGVAVDIYNAEALVVAIEKFYLNPQLLKSYGEAGAIRAEKYYRIEDQIEKITSMYNQITSKN